MLNKEQIKEIIPQREPFLMIDEVEEYIPGESAVAYKYVNEEEWYFKGHFPGNPIMPGVLITESLAQAGAIAILSMEENKGKNALFGGIDKMKFKKMVVPILSAASLSSFANLAFAISSSERASERRSARVFRAMITPLFLDDRVSKKARKRRLCSHPGRAIYKT